MNYKIKKHINFRLIGFENIMAICIFKADSWLAICKGSLSSYKSFTNYSCFSSLFFPRALHFDSYSSILLVFPNWYLLHNQQQGLGNLKLWIS